MASRASATRTSTRGLRRRRRRSTPTTRRAISPHLPTSHPTSHPSPFSHFSHAVDPLPPNTDEVDFVGGPDDHEDQGGVCPRPWCVSPPRSAALWAVPSLRCPPRMLTLRSIEQPTSAEDVAIRGMMVIEKGEMMWPWTPPAPPPPKAPKTVVEEVVKTDEDYKAEYAAASSTNNRPWCHVACTLGATWPVPLVPRGAPLDVPRGVPARQRGVPSLTYFSWCHVSGTSPLPRQHRTGRPPPSPSGASRPTPPSPTCSRRLRSLASSAIRSCGASSPPSTRP